MLEITWQLTYCFFTAGSMGDGKRHTVESRRSS